MKKIIFILFCCFTLLLPIPESKAGQSALDDVIDVLNDVESILNDIDVILNGPTTTTKPPTTSSSSSSSKLANGTYYIKAAKNKDLVFTIYENTQNNFGELTLYKQVRANNQKFKVTNISGNKYTITAVHSGKRLTSTKIKGQTVTQYYSSSKKNQAFTITKKSDGTYRIQDGANYYFDVCDGKFKNNTRIIVWPYSVPANQSFVFQKV